MPGIDQDRVLAADDAWVWFPDSAETLAGPGTTRGEDYLLVLFPDWFTFPQSQVLLTHSDRQPADLVAEVQTVVREHGRTALTWWVRDGMRPAGLEAHLVALGAELDETLSILARSLDDRLPAPSTDVEVRAVTDRAGLEDWERVGAEVFGGEMPPDTALDRSAASMAASTTELHVTAYLEGRPVGAAGVTLADGAARLWGGGTVTDARRRGVYAALLRARLDWARERGATFALTRGRVESSAPLLRRVGFEVLGEKRSYRLEA